MNSPYLVCLLAVDFPKHDVERTQDCGNIRQKVPLAQEIHRLKMSETGRPDLALVRLVCTVGDEIDAKLSFRRLDGNVDFSGGNVKSFGEKLEVVNERFH